MSVCWRLTRYEASYEMCTRRNYGAVITRFADPLKPSCHYMYRQFNIQQFYVLPTRCIYVFCVDLRTNSDYFTVQH
jgi:hypothetical protein